jgi:hypothetical protein
MYNDDCRSNIKCFIFYFIVVVMLMTLNNSVRGCGYWARFADAGTDADEDLADVDTTLFIRAGVYL